MTTWKVDAEGRCVGDRVSWFRRLPTIVPAVMALAATIASFCSLYVIAWHFMAGSSAAILSAVLAMTLSRRHAARGTKEWLAEFAALPLLALGATGIGWLLYRFPLLGASLFIVGLAGGIWVRQFGAKARALGTVATLPLIAILITPTPIHAAGGWPIDVLLGSLAGMVASGWVRVLHAVSTRMGWLERDTLPVVDAPRRPSKEGQVPASTRMAAQMAVALTASFAFGWLAFGTHWPWVVITAFVVMSRSAGRGDALYKSLLRLGGAMAGTLLAAILQHASSPHGLAAAILIFAILFVGIWLREWNYAIWAGCVTLILAILQPGDDQAVLATLILRIGAIVVGAACAVSAAWWVLPIRTESVARRYLADLLQSLEELAGVWHTDETARRSALQAFDALVARLERISPPLAWHHRLSGAALDADHPAVWIRIALRYPALVAELDVMPAELVRTVRLARRTIGQRDMPIATALTRLSGVLAGR